MVLTTRQFLGIVLVTSGMVLGSALLSQYWGGLAPCELCLLERWPWFAAIMIGVASWLLGDRLTLPVPAILLAIVFIVSAGLAFYHVGVEQHWFRGPIACTGSPGAGAQTLDDLRRQLLAAQPVMCDQVQWSLFGISLAGFNLLGSLVMAAFCAGSAAWLAPRRVPA
ncbi:MAG TPA: disulfide bond formation protein B [Stellaceae bacterium]|nr:disulfide bond formation protein B [Stellaceae bacterium]